jgi:hypothetical protein
MDRIRLSLIVLVRGNVAEAIAPGGLRVTLVRRGRVIGRYLTGARQLLPGSRGLVRLRLARRARGVAVLRVRLHRPGLGWSERRFRLRL